MTVCPRGQAWGSCSRYPHPSSPPIAPPLAPLPHPTSPHGPSLAPYPGTAMAHPAAPRRRASPRVGAHPDALPAGFHERDGKPYCRQDFVAMFAPKCQGCARPVTDDYLSALQGVWHPECFVCAVSGQRAGGDAGASVSPRLGQPPPSPPPPGVPERLRRRLLLRARRSALLRAALPPAAGQHLPQLRPPGDRPLRHGRGAQVPPRALHLRLLLGPAAERHLPRAGRQDVLPGLPQEALPLSPGPAAAPRHTATPPTCLGAPGVFPAIGIAGVTPAEPDMPRVVPSAVPAEPHVPSSVPST